MKFAVIVFPGSNCDHDTYHVVSKVIGQPVQFIWHRATTLDDCDVVILPGGFSYGDYLRCGAIARFSPVMQAVKEFAGRGGLVLGICNGFQILCEAGLLPGALMRNAGQRFLSRPVRIRVETTDTPCTTVYTRGEEITVPVAHGDGRFVADERTLRKLEAEGRVVWRYVGENPNGSAREIAGVCSASRTVVGLMPHPERRNSAALGGSDGARVFLSLEAGHATQHAGGVRVVDGHHAGL